MRMFGFELLSFNWQFYKNGEKSLSFSMLSFEDYRSSDRSLLCVYYSTSFGMKHVYIDLFWIHIYGRGDND